MGVAAGIEHDFVMLSHCLVYPVDKCPFVDQLTELDACAARLRITVSSGMMKCLPLSKGTVRTELATPKTLSVPATFADRLRVVWTQLIRSSTLAMFR